MHAAGDCSGTTPVTTAAHPWSTVADLLLAHHWSLVSAESCTGGMVASACTDLAGSSAWFERGFVTYSNASKSELLGVPTELVAQRGAVSEEVARAMALGALQHSRAQVAIATTGIAGPGGGSVEKPVGTVWFAWAWPYGVYTASGHFSGERSAVRRAATQYCGQQLVALLSTAGGTPT